ncbi:MAG: LytTR family DNA-binding domain-containing protein [bacterium]
MDAKQPRQTMAKHTLRQTLATVPQFYVHQVKPPAQYVQAKEQLKKGQQYRPEDSVFLKLNNRYQLIRIQAIIIITSAGHYTMLVTTDGQKGLVSKSMGAWESELPSYLFIRIHRTTIVNLNRIARVENTSRNIHRLYLEHFSEPLIISDRYLATVKRFLK